MSREPLPIDAVLPDVVAGLAQAGAVVLASPPGSGKTTRVPGALLDAGLAGEVIVLQPRRIAARAAARRVAFERGSAVGAEVGYQVRHDRKVSKHTRIRFVTEGVLARRLVRDPFLEGVAAVVLDEFHERSLEADLTLAMLAEVRATVRADLQIVVMSATLDSQPIVDFLAPCAAVTAEGRPFEVTVEHLPGDRDLAVAVLPAVRAALEATAGDVLVFLPGVGEIQRCARALRELAVRRDFDLRPLHGQLPAAAQDAAIRSGPRRKVVLATNVAETSLTIEGVTAVVDSGFARVLRHDVARGLDRLEKTRISRAAAEQRRGRAGRTGPGHCYRLWSLAEERGLVPFELPEIRRLDLSSLDLSVRAFAGRDPRAFDWFEAPEAAALDRADELLHLLGALDGDRLTTVGENMLRHPLHPRLARMVEEGARRGCVRTAAELAALLSERDVVSRGAASDVFAWRDRLHAVEASGFHDGEARRLGIDVRAARNVVRVRDQIAGREDDRSEPDEATIARTMLAAYPDRVGGRSDEHTTRGVLATGRGFELTMADHEELGSLLLALQVRESGDRVAPRALVDLACAIEEAWLSDVFPGSVVEETAAEWLEDRGTARAIKRRRFGRLVLEERLGGSVDPDQLAPLLEAELAKDPWRHLGEQSDLRGFLARLAWLRRQRPEAELPEVDDAAVARAALAACPGIQRLADLRKAPVLDVLVATLPQGVAHTVRTQAPERLTLPTGRHARVDYEVSDQPVVAARLQEFFGLSETPRLGGGRVPVLLHLLGPNHRPVQITQDLASFWANTYPGVRAELKRRYPKHAWPEDPLSATPESRPRRRR